MTCCGGRLVEVRGRLVEDEDGRVGEQRAGERDPLALTAGQLRSLLPHHRRRAVGQRRDPVREAGAAQRETDLRLGRRRAGQAHVLVDARREEMGVLTAHRDVAADVGLREVADVGARRA